MRRLLLVAHVACGSAFMSKPRSAASVALRAAKARAKRKGFGGAAPPPAPTAGPRARWAEGPPDAALEARLDALEDSSIVDVLNPAVLDGLEDVREKLRAGEVVILRDAFRPDFAEACYRELASRHAPWSANEDYFEDGYGYRHLNVYDRALWSRRLNATFAVFDHAETKAWVSALAERDCGGACTGAPSKYRAGDHSLPHTDWVGQRTVAYVWHLSKAWRPEWGGALYWAQNDHDEATYPASFNQLCLFSVTTTSAHFVTTVSPRAERLRLTFNGWWQSSWWPRDESHPVWKSTSVSGARGRPGSVELRGTGIATPSSRHRVDGVEVDAKIQRERAVKF
ncbi:unnamed protein product [Pelagomonas calceolata]|uniref:Prolyl 3,4-dihydroxylase TPA1/OFD1 N-terminal domain-containing protein n=1 Tax=Pelagomonas calceolata TaxID=35677 RepID=A0A8J2SXX2_9STRA|nr:unnamed protein product [Pelagomonas calceolata]